MANYSTSYFGDDDEEEKRRALSALAGADATGSFDQDFSNDPEALAGSQPQYDQTPPEPEPPTAPVEEREPTSRTLDSGRSDPFDEAAAAMASEHPEASSGGGEDWGPLGGGVGWALAADLLLNGGRNATTVMALGAQAAEQRKKAGLEGDYKRAQIEHLKHQGVTDPRVLEQRQRQMDQRDRALGHGEAVLDDRQNARGEKTAQGKANTDAVLGLYDREGLDTSPLKGGNMEAVRAVSPVLRRQYDVAHADETNAIAAEKAGGVARAQTQSRSDVGAENADQDAETAARKAGAVAEAQAPYAIERAGSEAAARLPYQKELKRTPGAPQDTPLDDEGNPRLTENQRRARSKDEQASTDKYVASTKDMSEAGAVARQLEGELAKYGPNDDIPGIGVIDSRKPSWAQSEDDSRIGGKVGLLRAAVQHHITGAASSGPEEIRIGKLAADLPGMTESQARVAIHEMSEYAKRNLRGAATGREDIAHRVLDNSDPGLGDWALGELGRAQSAPNSTAIAPDRLPVTGPKRRDIPKVDDYLRKYGASWVR